MREAVNECHLAIIDTVVHEKMGIAGEIEAGPINSLTNTNYLVTAGDVKMVFRIPGDGTQELIDRSHELEIMESAAEIGLDDKPLYYDSDTGIKVMRYIENAQTMTVESLRDPQYIQMAARLLRTLHDATLTTDAVFDPYDTVLHYEELIHEVGPIDYEGYDDLRSKLFSYRDELEQSERVLCHCDPICENFIIDPSEDRMHLIDWEYAGMNDPLWDVADFIIECDYERPYRDMFQEAYFGRPATDDEDRLISIYIVLIDFVWGVWGLQRCEYDHTLDDYGPERLERAKRNCEALLLGL